MSTEASRPEVGSESLHNLAVRDQDRHQTRFVPQFPRLRYVLSGWGVLFACIFASVSLAAVNDEPDMATVTALFAVLGLWAAWRWWRMGALVGRRLVVFRDALRSRSFPRTAQQTVSAVERSAPVWRRLLLGDWLMTHEVVLKAPGAVTGKSVGLLFGSLDGAELFAGRVNEALND